MTGKRTNDKSLQEKCKLFSYAKKVEWRDYMEEFQIIDNCLMVKMPSEIDHHRAGFISEKADEYLLSDKVQHVVFDFENTHFMDSSGIGIIMGRYRKISYLGGKVYAIHTDDYIKRMLMLSGVNKLVDVR